MRRHICLLVAGVLALAVLAGCEGVDTSGTVSSVCVDRVTGAMRAATICRSNEVASRIPTVAGPQGPQGPAAPTPTQRHVSSSVEITTGTAGTAQALCLNTERLVTGGYYANYIFGIIAYASLPVEPPGTPGWSASVTNQSGGDITLYVFAICETI